MGSVFASVVAELGVPALAAIAIVGAAKRVIPVPSRWKPVMAVSLGFVAYFVVRMATGVFGLADIGETEVAKALLVGFASVGGHQAIKTTLG